MIGKQLSQIRQDKARRDSVSIANNKPKKRSIENIFKKVTGLSSNGGRLISQKIIAVLTANMLIALGFFFTFTRKEIKVY